MTLPFELYQIKVDTQNQLRINFICLLQLVELSKAQDVEAGDGTTSVVVIAGALLEAARQLLQRGIHPTLISESFQKAALKAVEILTSMSRVVDLNNKSALVMSAATSLNSKVIPHLFINSKIMTKKKKLFLLFDTGCVPACLFVGTYCCRCCDECYRTR